MVAKNSMFAVNGESHLTLLGLVFIIAVEWHIWSRRITELEFRHKSKKKLLAIVLRSGQARHSLGILIIGCILAFVLAGLVEPNRYVEVILIASLYTMIMEYGLSREGKRLIFEIIKIIFA